MADGSEVELVSYVAYLQWFGQWQALQVIASDEGAALFGTALLDDCEVRMNFGSGSFTIEKTG